MPHITYTINTKNIGDILNDLKFTWVGDLIDYDRLDEYSHVVDLYYHIKDGEVTFDRQSDITRRQLNCAAMSLVVKGLMFNVIKPMLPPATARMQVQAAMTEFITDYAESRDVTQQVYEDDKIDQLDHYEECE